MLEVGKYLFGNRSVARARQAGVEDTEHQACPVTTLGRQSRIGRHTLSEHRVPETFDGNQSVWRQFVEHDERAERATMIGVCESDVVMLAS